MKQNVGAGYIGFIQGGTRALVGHLYTFTTAAGANDYFTDLDIDIVYPDAFGNKITYKSGGIRIDGLRRKLTTGLQVDEQKCKIYATPSDTIFGATFLTAMESGIMDGGTITRQRIVFPLVTGNLATDIANPPTGAPYVWTLFIGYMGQIEKGGQTHIECRIRSPLVKLEVNMPRNYYQPGCLWTLYDTGCTLVKASFGTNYTISARNFTTITPTTPITTPTGADGLPNYAQGRLLFTSGTLNNTQILINNNDSVSFYLSYPLSGLPLVGDTFTAYPGCNKSFNTCDVKFNNKANFRGFDKVPPIMLSV